ncbi:MAG: glycosyltransferase, partial [Cyanobacteria bacterium J06649_11]
MHDAVSDYNLLQRTHNIDFPPDKGVRLFKGILLFLISLFRKPKSTIRSLNFWRYGKHALSLALFYTAFSFKSERDYDIIHCHFGPNGITGIHIKEIFDLECPVITTFHGYDAGVIPSKMGSSYYNLLFDKCDLIIVGSDFMKGRLSYLGASETKLLKLPVGIDLSFFKRPIKKSRVTRSVTNFLSVGRLIEGKGHKYSLLALAKVKETHPDFHYHIIGSGTCYDELKSLVNELKIDNNVTFHGAMAQKDVLGFYISCDIFLFPSITDRKDWEEGQGLALIEAQALGLPIVSTLSGGISESVLDQQSS